MTNSWLLRLMFSATRSGSPHRPRRSGNSSRRMPRLLRGARRSRKSTGHRRDPSASARRGRSSPPADRPCANAIFRWEEGRRHAFSLRVDLPLFKRFAEDYIVEPDGDETLFTWVVAIEPKGALALPLKVIAPAVKAAFGRIRVTASATGPKVLSADKALPSPPTTGRSRVTQLTNMTRLSHRANEWCLRVITNPGDDPSQGHHEHLPDRPPTQTATKL